MGQHTWEGSCQTGSEAVSQQEMHGWKDRWILIHQFLNGLLLTEQQCYIACKHITYKWLKVSILLRRNFIKQISGSCLHLNQNISKYLIINFLFFSICFLPQRSRVVAQSQRKWRRLPGNSWRDRHGYVFNNGNGHSRVRLVALSWDNFFLKVPEQEETCRCAATVRSFALLMFRKYYFSQWRISLHFNI